MARYEEIRMLNLRNWSVSILALAIVTGTCFGQDDEPAKFYKLDFVVKEVEGAKVLNARTYSVLVSGVVVTHGREMALGSCSIRTGSKIPYSTGKESTYLDVGVSIDCKAVKEAPGGLTMRVDADVSSVAQESTTPTNLGPVVRQNKWESNVIVPLKKPTLIFSSDDLTSKHQMQVELTATPIT
jgi:hypothetical protein